MDLLGDYGVYGTVFAPTAVQTAENRVCWAQSSCDHSLSVWLEKEKEAKKETFNINFHKSVEQGNQSL